MLEKLFGGIAVAVLSCSISASASVSSIGIDTPILTEASAIPTGNINTSNIFELDTLKTTNNASGVFSGLTLQNFGLVTLEPASKTAISFSDTAFGYFASRAVVEVLNTAGFRNMLISGTYTPGTFETGLRGPVPADLRVSFTQTPAGSGEISFSGTLAILPVPEVPTALLIGSGLALLLLVSKGKFLAGRF